MIERIIQSSDTKPYTGIILCGGKSLRMGTEKGLVQLKGKSLISYSISLFENLCSEVIISSNSNYYNNVGLKVVSDIYPDCGPIGGLYSGLKAATNNFCMVAPCDTPFLTAQLYRHLLSYCDDAFAIIPSFKGNLQPVCGIYATKGIPIIEKCIQQKVFKMHTLVQELNAVIVSVDIFFNENNCFENINTSEQLLEYNRK